MFLWDETLSRQAVVVQRTRRTSRFSFDPM
ncbi:hypothetical protein SBRY_20890 [Actinacidiphila bryophytorum]|uniref:Uncharacterized protein n=1 Tax=Actinacidiphila bryophytorum TaxID=1436133 RepID=A0A9W4E6U3_9ACTN|nr:hypothetical protein SBRY_20890 [Actinacidiphila bryophytorum]